MTERMSLLLGRILTFRVEDLKREDGQTTVEYGLVVAVLVAGLVTTFAVFNAGVSAFMTDIKTELEGLIP